MEVLTGAFTSYNDVNILGIDPSLNSTGLCLFKGERLVKCYRVQTGLRDIPRLIAIRDTVKRAIEENNVVAAGMEGYVYGSAMMVNRSFDLHELGGILKTMMYEHNIPYYIFAPTSIKKFATGNARKVKKEDMCAGIKSLWNLNFNPKKQNDLADAYVIGKLAYYTHVAISIGMLIDVKSAFSKILKDYQVDVLKNIKARIDEKQ